MINIYELKNRILQGYVPGFDEGVLLSAVEDKEALYRAANEIRKHFCGNTMDLCSITNARSGKCTQDCKWCSQSKLYTTDAAEYEMIDHGEAVKAAVDYADKGVNRYSLVTSGKRINNNTLDQLIPVYKEIREKCNIGLCASMGLISENQLRRLKVEAGIEHYHCNLETAPSFFQTVCTSHSIQEKIETIKNAQKAGLKVCSGGIFGMGETMEQRVELAAVLSKLGVQSIPINILMPVKGTPLEHASLLTEEEILTSIAVFRFLNPVANIRFAGGRQQIKHYQQKAVEAGINAALTGNNLTTCGSNTDDDIQCFTSYGLTVGNQKRKL